MPQTRFGDIAGPVDIGAPDLLPRAHRLSRQIVHDLYVLHCVGHRLSIADRSRDIPDTRFRFAALAGTAAENPHRISVLPTRWATADSHACTTAEPSATPIGRVAPLRRAS